MNSALKTTAGLLNQRESGIAGLFYFFSFTACFREWWNPRGVLLVWRWQRRVVWSVAKGEQASFLLDTGELWGLGGRGGVSPEFSFTTFVEKRKKRAFETGSRKHRSFWAFLFRNEPNTRCCKLETGSFYICLITAWPRITCEETVFSEPTSPCQINSGLTIICHTLGGIRCWIARYSV